MPYIKKEDREKFNIDTGEYVYCIADELASHIVTEGELNYIITKLCHGYLKKHGLNYKNLNAVHGVLSCADKELYRRVTAPYEEKKIAENGDVNEMSDMQ